MDKRDRKNLFKFLSLNMVPATSIACPLQSAPANVSNDDHVEKPVDDARLNPAIPNSDESSNQQFTEGNLIV